MSAGIKEAIILAGGLGTRLREAVPDLPKCMAPVHDRPFLQYVIDHAVSQGIERLIFSLGYRHEDILSYLAAGSSPVEMAYSIEQEPLGTGGAILKACHTATTDHVAILNGDTLFRTSLKATAELHLQNKADCTLTLCPMKQFSRYGVVELNEEKRVMAFREKQFYEEGWINGGVYILDRQAYLNENLPEKHSFEKDYLESMSGKRRFYGSVQQAYFIDIGIPKDYLRAQYEL